MGGHVILGSIFVNSKDPDERSIMLHFIRVYTAVKVINLQTKEHNVLKS